MYAYPTVYIPKLHFEYRLWVTELNFFKEEIKLFEKYLEEIVSKNMAKEATPGVEHFQNSFFRKKEVIDILKHELHQAEWQLIRFVKQLSGMGLMSIKMDNHSGLREKMQIFRKLYTDLKKDFRRFESEWM